MALQVTDKLIKQAVVLDLKATDSHDLSLKSLESLPLNWLFVDQAADAEVAELIKNKQIVVTNKVKLNRQLLETAPDLKLICISATGTNNVDLTAARELGIDVCNVTAYATASVVQYVFTVLLSLVSRVPEYQQAVNEGAWSRSELFCLLDFPFHELQGKTLGIVGYGELGQAVAKVAQAFGMEIIVAARNADDKRKGRMLLQDMLPKTDVLSLHCPLTDATQQLISDAEFNLLPQGAIVINSARGGVVEESALLRAIENGHLGGAATDVLSTEPPAPEHPLLQKKYNNLIVTPHVAWASIESRQRLIDQVAFTIKEYLAGRPCNIVN